MIARLQVARFYRDFLDDQYPGMYRRQQILSAAREHIHENVQSLKWNRIWYEHRRDGWAVILEVGDAHYGLGGNVP